MDKDTELLYNDVPMSRYPSQIASLGLRPSALHHLNEIKKAVMVDQHPVFVVLEPGDATRYDLLLARVPEKPLVAVAYFQQEKAVTFYSGRQVYPWDMVGLTSNEWSRRLLAWWLTLVFE